MTHLLRETMSTGIALMAVYAGSICLCAQDDYSSPAASTAREAQRQANAARAMAYRALQKLHYLETQPIDVLGETPEERAARHQAVRRQIDEAATVAFAKEHPFLPKSHQPETNPDIYLEAFRLSDEQALGRAQAEALARRHAEMAAIKARIADLERQIANPTRVQSPDHRPTQEEQRAIADYNRQFDASQSRAEALYEFARDANSPGGKRMLEIDATLRANNDPLYCDPNKPLIIAQMVAKEMGIAPKSAAATLP